MQKALAAIVLPKSLRDDIAQRLDPLIRFRKNREPASRKTRDNKWQFYNRMFAELWVLGYKIRNVGNFRPRHVEALMMSWSDKSVSELHTRLSMMNLLLEFLGKGDQVKSVRDYFPERDTTRKLVAQENKSWEARDIDVEALIEKARALDERLGCILALQHHFGLRVKEAIEMRPLRAASDGEGAALLLIEGTKGGRPRIIPIKTTGQRQAIEWACALAKSAKSERMRWPRDTWKQSQAKFYYRCSSWLGISRKELGVTAHGLRHGFAQTAYRRKTGMPTPIEGGALGRIDRTCHAEAARVVAQQLGHGRIYVSGSYYGSYGHQLRGSAGEQNPQIPSSAFPDWQSDCYRYVSVSVGLS
ncbi:MAG: integrase domain-containing protein [Zoogloeaceae bacterium]|nr:integrase domain-containing protein [Zoogloeaceae bacterium]